MNIERSLLCSEGDRRVHMEHFVVQLGTCWRRMEPWARHHKLFWASGSVLVARTDAWRFDSPPRRPQETSQKPS